MAGEHERGRIFAVNRVKRGGIEIHRGIMREYHGVVAGLAGIEVKTRRKRVGTQKIQEFRAVDGRNITKVRHHHAGCWSLE